VAQHRQHHQSCPSARSRGKRGASKHGIGRSRGGLTTKVHLVVDALGLPLIFELTEGQRHDSRPACELVQRAQTSCCLADKAYDSDAFRLALDNQGCVPVIPSNASRAGKLPYDKELYKSRAEIECTFNVAQASQALRYSLRENSPQLRCGRGPWLCAAVAACLSRYSSQLCASLMSIDTMRTSMLLAVLCPPSSNSSSLTHTSKSAADSVADPRAVT
jgi:transposase